MKRFALALLAALSISSIASATSQDVALSTPALVTSTVAKVCLTSETIDLKHQTISVIFESCTAPGSYTGDLTTLTITTAGYVLQPPLAGPIQSGPTPNWASVAPVLSGAPQVFKTLLLSVVAGS